MHENREKDLEKKKDLPNIENITNNNINEVIPIEKKKKKNMFTIFRRRKEKQQEEELKAAEYTTIDDYFGEEVDCETIFFDTDLVLKWKEKGFSKEYTLSDFPISVGKLRGSVQVVMEDDSISRLHAKIMREKGDVFIQDLDSTNGTFVNGQRLFSGQKVTIHREDEIQFGKITVNVV